MAGLFAVALGAEEALQDLPAFRFHDAGDDVAAMDQVRMLDDVEYGYRASAFRVRCAEYDSRDACKDDGSGAHGTWLLCDVEDRLGQSPVTVRGRRLCNGDHFGVSGRVVQALDLVVRATYDLAVEVFLGRFSNDHAPGRYFVLLECLLGLAQRHTHIVFVQRHGVSVPKRQSISKPSEARRCLV
jgi:hypothetical protein